MNSKRDARRIAVRPQWLHADRLTELLALVRHISLLQLDMTTAVAPSADLVCWSRLGSGYDVAELEAACDERRIIDLRGTLRPVEDLALYRAEVADWPGQGALRDWQENNRDWVDVNDGCRREILELLRIGVALDGSSPVVDLAPVSKGHDDNQEQVVGNCVDDAVVADPNTQTGATL